MMASTTTTIATTTTPTVTTDIVNNVRTLRSNATRKKPLRYHDYSNYVDGDDWFDILGICADKRVIKSKKKKKRNKKKLKVQNHHQQESEYSESKVGNDAKRSTQSNTDTVDNDDGGGGEANSTTTMVKMENKQIISGHDEDDISGYGDNVELMEKEQNQNISLSSPPQSLSSTYEENIVLNQESCHHHHQSSQIQQQHHEVEVAMQHTTCQTIDDEVDKDQSSSHDIFDSTNGNVNQSVTSDKSGSISIEQQQLNQSSLLPLPQPPSQFTIHHDNQYKYHHHHNNQQQQQLFNPLSSSSQPQPQLLQSQSYHSYYNIQTPQSYYSTQQQHSYQYHQYHQTYPQSQQLQPLHPQPLYYYHTQQKQQPPPLPQEQLQYKHLISGIPMQLCLLLNNTQLYNLDLHKHHLRQLFKQLESNTIIIDSSSDNTTATTTIGRKLATSLWQIICQQMPPEVATPLAQSPALRHQLAPIIAFDGQHNIYFSFHQSTTTNQSINYPYDQHHHTYRCTTNVNCIANFVDDDVCRFSRSMFEFIVYNCVQFDLSTIVCHYAKNNVDTVAEDVAVDNYNNGNDNVVADGDGDGDNNDFILL